MSAISKTATRETASEGETRQIGLRLGRSAGPGDLVCLIGDLGGGKTTFAQGIGAGLGLGPNAVSSPTFTLVAEHFEGRLPLYHLDVYRLADPGELYHLGFEDYLGRADGLIVIEWADKVAEALPGDRLEIRFVDESAQASRRTLVFESHGPRSTRLLRETLPSDRE